MASLDSVLRRMDDVSEKDGVPSNVSEMLERAMNELQDEDKELSVRVNSASSILDEISNDPNIKQHTRTEIWNLASKVESLNED
jgi:uncharacterized protein (UPF0147 family)